MIKSVPYVNPTLTKWFFSDLMIVVDPQSFVFKLFKLFICSSFSNILDTDMVIITVQNDVKL